MRYDRSFCGPSGKKLANQSIKYSVSKYTAWQILSTCCFILLHVHSYTETPPSPPTLTDQNAASQVMMGNGKSRDNDDDNYHTYHGRPSCKDDSNNLMMPRLW